MQVKLTKLYSARVLAESETLLPTGQPFSYPLTMVEYKTMTSELGLILDLEHPRDVEYIEDGGYFERKLPNWFRKRRRGRIRRGVI